MKQVCCSKKRFGFFSLFSIFVILLPIILAQGILPTIPSQGIVVKNLVPQQYNLLFNPYNEHVALGDQFQDVVYQWDASSQSWVDADKLTSGEGFAAIPKTNTVKLSGKTLRDEIKVKKGFFLIGTLSDKPTQLSDLIIAETGASLTAGSTEFYAALYKYDPAQGYLDVEQGDLLQPGAGYFIDVLKPFTIKIKGVAPQPTGEITCNKDADRGRYKCVITEEQYLTPEKLDVGHERDILQCKKEGTAFTFAPALKDDAKKIGENGKCVVGYACRTDAAKSKAGCQESSPPPFRDPTNQQIIGSRPAVNLP